MRAHIYISYLIIALTCLSSPSLYARDAAMGAKSLLQNQSLAFIENKGQITDQYHHSRPDIQYKLSAAGVNVFVGNGQLHYQWLKNTTPNPSFGGVADEHTEPDSPPSEGVGEVSTYRLDVTLIGANTQATVITSDPLPETEHYTTTQTGPKGVTAHVFTKVTYQNIYPNIDWVLYTSNNQLKYDFVVHPGGRVSDIRLSYDGANSLTAGQNGLVTAVTPMGTITEQAPYSYETETGKTVSSSFSRQGNVLGFTVDNYSGTLTIDPLLSWATYYGGSSGDDHISDVTCDAAGTIYVVGATISANNIATSGSHQNSFSGPTGYYDAFVAVFNKSGQRIWGSYFGDTATDYGTRIACDAFGHVYITGITYSPHNIATPGAYQVSLAGGLSPDAYIAKFDAATGGLIWSTYYGGNNEEDGYGIVCDKAGNVYIAGNTYSTNGIATANAYHPFLVGPSDAFLSKFDSSGHLVWGTYVGGSSFDMSTELTIDRYGALYLAGTTNSPFYVASTGAFQDTLSGTKDAFLSKFDTSGHIIWSTYFGSGADGNSVICDSAGNVFLAGETTSTTGIATAGSFQPVFTAGGFNEGYIVKFTSAGQRLWSTYFGGSGTDYLNDMSCDPAGNLYITGSTASVDNIATPGAHRTTNNGENAFMAKFRSDGKRIYGTYFGGNSGYEVGNGIANDGNGTIYIVGATGSDSAIVTPGAFQSAFQGPYCGYLASFSSDTNVYIQQPYTDTLFCSAGDTLDLHVNVLNHFSISNIFTVQLSDSTGSFASATAIAAVLDSTNGIITCVFPPTAHGDNYRVRVVASQPVDTSSNDGLNIVLSTTPSAPVTAGSNSPICENDALHLSASDTTAGVTYSWTKPDSTFVYGQNPSLHGLHVSDSGNYYVVAMLHGCPSAPDTVAVQINASPARPTDSTNSPICVNDTLFITAYDSTAGITYNWTGPHSFSDSTQGFTIPNAQTFNTGKYIVTASLNGCNSIPDTVNVTVHQLVVPSATIIITPSGPLVPSELIALTTNITNGGANPTIQWYKNNVAIPGATFSPYYSTSFVNGDFVKLVVHSSDPCASPDSSVTMSGLLGVNNINSASGNISLYPNPNNGVFTVTFRLNSIDNKEITTEILNVLGQVVYKEPATAANGMLHKDIQLDSNLPGGVYLLHIRAGGQDSLLRFTLQR